MAVNRKLAAVAFADVVGYSRLMERDEAGTHARLTDLRAGLIDPKIAEHGGRIVRTTGDGLLFEFPSATAALRCAVEVQREMGTRNLFVASDERIELRIGINLGDIIVEGDDIIGDGVNVAARLETLATPGGICVASAVWEQVHEDLGVEFIDAGEQQVKNISKPVHVYRVSLGKGLDQKAPAPSATTALANRPLRSPASPFARRALIGGVVLAIFAVGALATWRALQPSTPATGAPIRALVVVPLSAPAGDPVLAAAAAQLTQDVTRALGDSMRDVRVVSPAMAAAAAAKSQDPRAIGRETNSRLLVEGDVRPAGGQVAMTLRLVDTLDGKQLENTRKVVDRAQFDDVESMVRLLTSSARVMAYDAIGRVAATGGAAATAQDYIDRADAVALADPAARSREVYRLSSEAVKLDPALSRAWSQRSGANIDLLLNDFSANPAQAIKEAEADSLRAVTLDGRDAVAWMARSMALGFAGSIDAGLAASDRAQDLDPTRYSVLLQRGWILMLAGRPEETARIASRLRQSLGPLDIIADALGCSAHVALGEYETAIGECERGAAADNGWFMHANLAAAYAQRGDAAKAAREKDILSRLVPGFTIAMFESRHFYPTPESKALAERTLLAGLRKAGISE